MYKTIDEFVNHEITVWGWETVESLFNRGYRVIATNRGYRWILPLDTDTEVCYDGGVAGTPVPVDTVEARG